MCKYSHSLAKRPFKLDCLRDVLDDDGSLEYDGGYVANVDVVGNDETDGRGAGGGATGAAGGGG